MYTLFEIGLKNKLFTLSYSLLFNYSLLNHASLATLTKSKEARILDIGRWWQAVFVMFYNFTEDY